MVSFVSWNRLTFFQFRIWNKITAVYSPEYMIIWMIIIELSINSSGIKIASIFRNNKTKWLKTKRSLKRQRMKHMNKNMWTLNLCRKLNIKWCIYGWLYLYTNSFGIHFFFFRFKDMRMFWKQYISRVNLIVYMFVGTQYL